MVLKMSCEKLEQSGNCVQKLFTRMRHIGLLVGISILELLSDFLHLEEHCFVLIGNSISEKVNGLNDVAGDRFRLFSCVNQCVVSHMGCNVAGDSRKERNSGRWAWTGRV